VAFLSLTSSQVDANSTLDETLFQLIRTNFDDLNTRVTSNETFAEEDIRTHFATNGLDASTWDVSASGATIPDTSNHYVELTNGWIAAASRKMRLRLNKPHSVVLEARIRISAGDESRPMIGFQDATLTTTLGTDLSDLMVIKTDETTTQKWRYYSAKAGVSETGTDFGNITTTTVLKMEIACVSDTDITVNVYENGVLRSTHTDESKMPTTSVLRPFIVSQTTTETPTIRCDYFRAYWTSEPLMTL